MPVIHHRLCSETRAQTRDETMMPAVSPSPATTCTTSRPSVMMMPVDPEPHMSSQFYTFNRASHRLMVRCLMAARSPTPDEIRNVATPVVLASWRGVWKDRPEDTAYLIGWKRIQDKLLAQVDDVGNEVLFFKNNPYQFVPFIEQWGGIVQQFHVGPDLKHLGLKETLERMREVWTVGAKLYGVPESFVKVCISTCPLCGTSSKDQPQQPQQGNGSSGRNESSESGGGQQPRRKKFEYTESFEVVARDVPQRLQLLAAKYKVVLCIRQKYIRYKPFLAEVKDYCCHRGGEPTGRKPGVLKRKRYMSKRCGCSFRIRAIVPITNYDEKEKTFSYQEEGVATFKLYAVHSGHEPGPHEGSARIIHRFVDPSSLTEDVVADADKEEYVARQTLLRQIQELQLELGNLEQRLTCTSVETLSSLCNDISGTLQRVRTVDKLADVPLERENTSEDVVGLNETWTTFHSETNKEQERLEEQQQHGQQQEQHQPNSQAQRRIARAPPRKTCARCCQKDNVQPASGFCKSCEVSLRQGGEDGSLDMSTYCTENDKWYDGVACGLDAGAHSLALGFGQAIS